MMTPDRLPNDVEALKTIIAGHVDVIARRDDVIAQHVETITAKDHTIAILSRIAFGKKSEKRPRSSLPADAVGQGHLFHAELVAEAERTAEAKKVQGEIVLSPPKRAPKRGGRRPRFPDHLPRVTTRYELEDDARSCAHCGGELHEIGQETTKELERLETAIVHEIRRAKYACRGCTDGVTTAPGPDRVIEKGLLGPGFLASVASERFGNHLPYNRLEKKYASEGLALSRSVLERSMKKCAEILEPIHGQLRKEVVAEPVLFTDDTAVTIARPQGRIGSIQGRVWIYLDREGRHSYDFTESRKRDGPQAVLGDYRGAIHADAYPGYDGFFGPEGATEVACWSHVRRKFDEAEKTEPALAAEAIERIGAIYGIEREAKRLELDDDARRQLRQQHSVALVNELFAWMAKTQSEVLPKGPMGQALAYALKLEAALRCFLDDGRLEADNNAAERALRAVAVGRKNWLFFQTEGGGDTAVVLLSLVMTAKAAGIDPRTYLRDVLLRIARETDVAKLTPHGWREHFQDEVEEQRQAAMAAFCGS
ncbi:MAG: IS66 family transposase [bacterium]|nr:IS66 family transposase [bacterium]